MLTQTKEVRDAWRASQRTLDIKVAVNGKTYTATDINSLKYDSGAYTGDTFAIGSTYSNNVQIEFSHLVEGLKLGMEVHPSIGIKTSKGYIYEPLGVFIISSEIKMDRNNNLTSISASDRFCGLEGTYKSKLVYPAKVLDIVAEICAQSGVKANADDLARLPHQADLPIPISGQSYRKALGWIAQLYAGYATFDRQGLFTIRTIAEPNYELDPSQYEQAGLTKNEAPYKIGGIQCQTVITTKTRDGENTEETKTYQVGDTSGSQIKLENNIMTPDRLNNIWEQIKDISFYPFTLNWFGNPAIEAGDWLRLEDKQGNKFIVPNNSYTLDFNGGLSATSKADQTSSTDSAISWRGTYAQIIEELQARKTPDGTVIFPPSVVEPPKNAKPNDVWFKQNGNSTELWVFTEQENGTGKWVRRDLTPDEIKKQVQEAQSGLSDAKKQIADNLAKTDGDIAELNASIREQKKAFDTDIDELNSSIRDQKGSLDGLSNTVNTVIIPKVTDVTNQVSDTITKVNEQKNIVTELQNQATQQGKDISKITTDVHGITVDLANLNGDVNQTKATVQGLQSTLGNAQGDIAQIKVDAKKLETSLSGKVDNSTYATFVSQTNQALNAKLVASDLNGYAKTTDLQATANGLQVNINSVSGKLDNLVIGNRNLVRNSGFPINTDYWNGPEIANHAFYYSDTKPLFLLKNNSSEKNYAESAYFPLKRNTTYVASFKGFSSVNVSSCDVFILARKYGENNKYTTVEHVVDAKRLSPSKVEYIKDLIFNSGENDEAYIRFDNNGSTNNEFGLLFFTEVKIEEGNKSTAWTPDPEDEQDRINGITSQLSAKITANSQQFSSYYTKTDIDKQRSSVQSQITQNATGLQSVVAKVDNIRIGGTNLIRDSAMLVNSHASWQDAGTINWHDGSVEVIKGDLIQKIPVKTNTTYTFSFDLWYQDMTDPWANQFFFVEYKDEQFTKTTNTYVDHRWAGDQFPNTLGRKDKKLTFTTQPDCTCLLMYIRQESDRNKPFHIAKPKLEEGNQATDWSPAPEDKANQSDLSSLNQTVKGIQSTVSSNYGNLQSQISQTAGAIRNEVTNKISGVQSQIDQTVKGLQSTVSSNYGNLQSQISQTAGTIRNEITNKVNGIQSQINQNTTGLQSIVTKVNNFQVGGTNLIRNSFMGKNSQSSWNSNGEVIWHDGSVEVKRGDLTQTIPAQPNTTYTFGFSLWYQDMTEPWSNQFFFVEYKDEQCTKTTTKYVDHHWAGDQFPNTAGRKDKKLTFTTQPDCYGLKIFIRQDSTKNKPFNVGKLKLELGNQATDWSPSPEDKANQSDFSALNQTVKGLQSTVSSNYGNLQSQINQTAGSIRNEVTNKISGVQSQITQNVNNLNLRLNNVSRNLVLNSGNFQDLHGWYTATNGALTLGKHGFWKNSSENVLWINNPSKTNEVTVSSARFDVVPHTTYTISFYAFASVNVTSSDLYFLGRKKSSNKDFDYVINPIALRRYSPSRAEYITATINTGDSEEGYIRFDNNGSTDGKSNLLGITDIQMEEGAVATPWKPAASDQVLAQINVAAGTTLIQNDKIYMDASSTVFSGKAFIPDAAITNISADKINAGTLDAGRINVINLNANNITTGTINGANLKINLNSGEILFQKGRIGSTNGNLNIDIDSGKMSVTNSTNSGVFFENGELYLSDNWAYGTNSQPKYGVIRRSIHSFTIGECGAEIASPSGISLQTTNYDGAFGGAGFLDQTTSGASVAIDRNGQALINAKQVGLTGGTFFSDNKFIPSKRRPRIVVGTDADASGLNLWGWGDPLNHVASRIVIDASYVHFPNSYNTTTGSAPNLYIASDGAIVRSTSASKYKTEIKRSYSTEYGEKLLNLPTAIWTDKGQKERYEAGKRRIKPERYFGMIAEDLADAGLDLLVSRNPQTHEIEGIQYERIAPALLPVIKELKDKVNKLEKKVNE
ncbi:gp58-like family protein [Lactobacillus johnsonii]|nr:gp58-like family protein [Lactobacillus johnsonii]